MHRRRPSRHTTQAQARSLSAYWDEVARRAPAEPVPPAGLDRDLAATVRHLSSNPSDAVPGPGFADQLLDRLVAASQERTTMSTASAVSLSPASARSNHPWSPASARQPIAATPASRRWSGVVAAAIAAVVVAALWVTSLGNGDPRGRRDTTVIAAIGSPTAALAPEVDPSTPSTTSDAVFDPGGVQAPSYAGVLDLSGPVNRVELWLVELSGGASVVIPPSVSPVLVMPLWDAAEESGTGTLVGAGEAFTIPTLTGAHFTVLGPNPNRLLVASFDGRLLFTAPDGAVFPARHLGELAIDPALDVGLLEVALQTTGDAGGSPIDTGRDGIVVISAEHSPTIVDVLAGNGLLRRATIGGGLQSPEDGVRMDPGAPGASPTYLSTGDVLTVTGGAAYALRSGTDRPIPVLAVTIRFDSARLDAIRQRTSADATPTSVTPLALAGCDVAPYTEPELRSLLATPGPDGLPSVGFSLADGVPADAQTAAEIDAAADLLGACARTGSVLQYARLWSAGGLRFVYSVENLDEDLRDAAGRDAFTPDPARIDASVQDVRVHPDGRVSAVVDMEGEVAYVVWVKQDGVYLVELFNDAIFAGPTADGARCDVPPLRPEELTGIVPEQLVPPTLPGDRGFDISSPNETPPLPVDPGAPGVDIATASVERLFDCLSTRDPARVYALATDGFRNQWAGVASGLVPLGEPQPDPETRLPIAVGTIYQVDVDETSGERRIGVLITGSITAYAVFVEVDGEWLIDGWAPL